MEESMAALLSMAMAAIILFFVFGSFSVFLVFPWWMRLRLQRNGLNGPPPTFPLGNLKEMTMLAGKRASSSSSPITHDIHSIVFPHFALWRKTYGKVFVYWLGTEPFLYVADPEFLKQITSGVLGKKWGKPNVFKYDRKPMFGNGLVMAEGSDWSQHRHIIAPAFSMTNLNAKISMMVETTTKMLAEWDSNLSMGQNEIEIEKDITINAAKIIANITFGTSNKDGKLLFEKLQAMQTMLFKTNRLVGVPFNNLLHMKKTHDARKLGDEIDQLLFSIISSRTNNNSTRGSGEDHEQAAAAKTSHDDVLGTLLATNQDNARSERKLTTRELVDECKTFFFGGHETTALALTWTLFLLALYPEWQKRLREEVMEVSGGGPLDSTIMLAKLTKMEWVFNEVLRLYSPAPNSQRQAREDIRVNEEILIPKGTNMWIDNIGMHHDPSLWGEDVNEFKPERFKESLNGGCKHRMGFIPFGFGSRLCIGRNLTATEYKVVLSYILTKFSMSISPNYLHSPTIMLTHRPSYGLPLILQPIDKSKDQVLD